MEITRRKGGRERERDLIHNFELVFKAKLTYEPDWKIPNRIFDQPICLDC